MAKLKAWLRGLPERHGRKTLILLAAILLLGFGLRAYRVVEPLPVPGDLGAQPTESEEVRSTALGGDWEFRGIRPPKR